LIEDAIGWAAEAGNLLYVLVALLVFGESAFLLDLFVPGEVGLVLASAAVRRADGSLALVIVLATMGAILGDSAGYWIGRRFGPGVANRWRFTRRRLTPALDRARERFEDRGGVTVFVARWVGALRAVVPVVAGAAGMPYPRFLTWSIPAAVAWSIVVASAGWYLGESAASLVDRLGWWISVVVVAVLAGWWVLRRRQHHRSAAETPATGESAGADASAEPDPSPS